MTDNLELEKTLWQAADKLRNNMDAAEYKHVVLGLIFLKYISDALEKRRAALEADRKAGADPEDPDGFNASVRSLSSRGVGFSESDLQEDAVTQNSWITGVRGKRQHEARQPLGH